MQDCEDALSPFQEGSLKEGTEKNGRTVKITPAAQECISKLHNEFETKMCDDLNTAHILTGAFQDALKLINSSLNLLKVNIWNLDPVRACCTHVFILMCSLLLYVCVYSCDGVTENIFILYFL